MEYFAQYLKIKVLHRLILSQTPQDTIPDFFGDNKEPITLPEGLGSFFAFADDRAIDRIRQGQSDISQLPEYERYALCSGWRLLNLGVKDDGTFSRKAYDGFLWCGFGEPSEENVEKLDDVSFRLSSERNIVVIDPKTADEIYVCDAEAYENARKKYFGDKPSDHYASDQDIDEFKRAMARTLIPVTEYKGDHVTPILLISRELNFDEVEILEGEKQ